MNTKLNTYNSVASFLFANQYITSNVPFEVLDSTTIPKGTYILTGDIKYQGQFQIENLHTGESHRLSDVVGDIGKGIKVRIASTVSTASTRIVERKLKQEAAIGIKSSINYTKTKSDYKISGTELNYLETELKKEDKFYDFKKFRDAKIKKETLKTMSVDFEAAVEAGEKDIKHENVFSGGTSVAEETITTLDAKSGERLKLKSTKYLNTEIFDINTAANFIEQINKISKKDASDDLGDAIQKAIQTDEFIYGKSNIAIMLEHLRKPDINANVKETDTIKNRNLYFKDNPKASELAYQEHLNELSKKNLRARSSYDILSELKKEGYGKSKIDKELNKYIYAISQELEKDNIVSKLREEEKQIKKNGTSKGRTIIKQLDGSRANATVESTLYFARKGEVVGASADIIDTQMQYHNLKSVGVYNDTELKIYDAKIKELEAVTTGAPNLNKEIDQLKKVRSHMKDVMKIGKNIVRSHLSEVNKGISESKISLSTLFKELKMESISTDISKYTINKIEHESDIKGFSLENMYRMFISKNANEFHVGSMDAADTGAYSLWLQKLIDNNEKGEIYVPTSKYSKVFKLADNTMMKDFGYAMARDIQTTTVISRMTKTMDINSIFDLYKKTINNASTRYLNNNKNVHNKLLKKVDNLEKMYKSSVGDTKKIGLVKSNVVNEYTDLVKKLHNMDYSEGVYKYNQSSSNIANPFTGKSKPLVGFMPRMDIKLMKFAAIAFMLWKGARDAPESMDKDAAIQQTIDRGEHNSIESISRRIATTPFGSPISHTTIGLFAKRLLRGFGRFTDDIAEISFHSDDIMSPGLKDMLHKNALAPAVHSAEAGYANRKVLEEIWTNDGLSDIKYNTYKKYLKQLPIDEVIDNVSYHHNESRFYSKLINKRNVVEYNNQYVKDIKFINEAEINIGSISPHNISSENIHIPSIIDKELTVHSTGTEFLNRKNFDWIDPIKYRNSNVQKSVDKFYFKDNDLISLSDTDVGIPLPKSLDVPLTSTGKLGRSKRYITPTMSTSIKDRSGGTLANEYFNSKYIVDNDHIYTHNIPGVMSQRHVLPNNTKVTVNALNDSKPKLSMGRITGRDPILRELPTPITTRSTESHLIQSVNSKYTDIPTADWSRTNINNSPELVNITKAHSYTNQVDSLYQTPRSNYPESNTAILQDQMVASTMFN